MSLDAMKQALEALIANRRTHYYCEDTWYSCPRHEEGCANDAEGDECNCGADKANEQIDNAITALRAAIEQAQEPETELETYKRLYELRGKALERPCSNCGHQPAKIKAMAQPEQELVCVCGAIWEDQELVSTPLPRQWQGLTDDEIVLICGECAASHADDIRYARAIESKLKEKNT